MGTPVASRPTEGTVTEPTSYEEGGDGPPPPRHAPGGGVAGGRDRMAVGALVAGILSVVLALVAPVLGILLGLTGIVLGVLARRRARSARTGAGLATAGIVLGAIGLVVGGLVAAFVTENAEEIEDLGQCLEDAGNDRAARDDCREEFNDRISAPAPVG